jgi:3-hydroxyacyl-[acyl-carrier-protein] dehydratase
MNRFEEETTACMSSLTRNEADRLIAHFVFPPEYIGFQGHFPERSVLPGICHIKAVMIMYKTWRKKEVQLREIVVAKFFLPVSPEETLRFECYESSNKEGDDQTRVKASASSSGKTIAKLELRLCFKDHP